MESTAVNRDPLCHIAGMPLHSIDIHCTMLHGIHCIQLGSIVPHCSETTAFNRHPLRHAAWNPLHSIGIHWASLHGIHCVQSRSIGPRCMESTAFNRDPFSHASWIASMRMQVQSLAMLSRLRIRCCHE